MLLALRKGYLKDENVASERARSMLHFTVYEEVGHGGFRFRAGRR